MWFQHDGAPAHFRADVRSALDTAYPKRWIGRGGPVNWPARSPDLSCLDFLSGHMKSCLRNKPRRLRRGYGCEDCRRSRRYPGDEH
ncbi:uncharacterized protein TNCV_4051561 [Trichonephila clavipes]|nr:uncharacterized protein TNCV_4051561 [Trichonephila clavipes]